MLVTLEMLDTFPPLSTLEDRCLSMEFLGLKSLHATMQDKKPSPREWGMSLQNPVAGHGMASHSTLSRDWPFFFQFAPRPLILSRSRSHRSDTVHEGYDDLFFLHMIALRRVFRSSSAMGPRHSYAPAATSDRTDEEDSPFISAELSEKRTMAMLGTNNFNRVMGLVNIILALVLAVSLALLAGSVTHDRKDARKDAVADTSVPYCK